MIAFEKYAELAARDEDVYHEPEGLFHRHMRFVGDTVTWTCLSPDLKFVRKQNGTLIPSFVASSTEFPLPGNVENFYRFDQQTGLNLLPEQIAEL